MTRIFVLASRLGLLRARDPDNHHNISNDLDEGFASGRFAPSEPLNQPLALEYCLTDAVRLCADLENSLDPDKQTVVASIGGSSWYVVVYR